MKKYIAHFIVSLLFTFMLGGCAQWGGDNPVGITGGSDEGYGQSGNLNLPQNGSDLVGSWRYDISESRYQIWTFSVNGNLTVIYYNNDQINTQHGTYTTSDNNISLFVGQQTLNGTFSIQGNHLTLYFGQDSLTLTKVFLKTE